MFAKYPIRRRLVEQQLVEDVDRVEEVEDELLEVELVDDELLEDEELVDNEVVLVVLWFERRSAAPTPPMTTMTMTAIATASITPLFIARLALL